MAFLRQNAWRADAVVNAVESLSGYMLQHESVVEK